MRRTELESIAARATYLRGLLAVPLGLLFVATGLGNLGWGPYRRPWVFVGSVLVLGGLYLAIKHYYDSRYGQAVLTTRQRVHDTGVSTVLSACGLVGGVILDSSFDLPVSLFAVAYAGALLGWFALTIGLRAHQWIVYGTLLVAGLLPIWGGLADKVSVAWLPIGGVTVLAGILDHRALARDLSSAADALPESSGLDA